MRPKWLQDGFRIDSFYLHLCFFRDLLPDLRFPMKNCFSRALKVSILDTFWNRIRQILGGFCHLGSCIPKEVSRYPHNYCRMIFLSLFGPNMVPSWLQLASSWVHAGHKLVPAWLKLDSCWAKIRVPGRPWANPSSSNPLPCGLCTSQTPICALQCST